MPTPIDDPIVKYYDAEASHYDRRWRPYIVATIKAVSLALDLRGSERLLDAPCGTGALESWLRQHYPSVQVVGVDASPSMLSWHMSGELIVLIILGGKGRLFGPVAGAILFVLIEFVLGGITERWQFFLGLILLGVVLFARGGLLGLLAGKARHG